MTRLSSLLGPLGASIGRMMLLATLILSSVAPMLSAVEKKTDPRDWPYWRGPEQNGISREKNLPEKWNPEGGEGSNLLWKREDMGTRSTPIVMNGKLYTIVRDEPETAREGEKVICVNAKTGKTIWENRFNVWLSDVPDTRVGWSSVVGDPSTGHVYVLGVCGYFACMDGESGKTIWSIPLHETFGLLSTYGGRTNFPIVFEDLVIINAVMINWGELAKPAHRFLAFNKKTGEVVWFTSTTPIPEDTTYSAPTITSINGQMALVAGAGDGRVWALQPRTGKPIWNYRISLRGLNVSPVVIGDKVIVSHSEENIVGIKSGAVAVINGALSGSLTDKDAIWKREELAIGKTAILPIGDNFYCFDDAGKLWVVDAKTGENVGKQMKVGTMCRSSPLYADGKIYYTEANGRWWILKPDESAGVKVLSKGKLGDAEECNASPIASHGRVYITSSGATYCIGNSKDAEQGGADPVPPPAVEKSVKEDEKPAQVQIVPCEALIKPGESQKFTVRLFNARGQFLKETSEATFTLQGPGEVSGSAFKAPSEANHTATIVTAKVGDLTGTARIRIVPPLPWKFDFEGLKDAPLPWVGARYRHVTRNVDGNTVMVKITTIPKGTRSRCWFGQPELHDYTIQADVKGSVAEKKLPDIGLIAQGYTLDMQGEHQKLVINTWVSHDFRSHISIPFKWEANTWYTMMLKASNENGKAVLRGKVWPKGEKEPEKWTIELTDSAPNVQGSPGLFGNATNAEIFIDNVAVNSNK